jgi:hypothetical protein
VKALVVVFAIAIVLFAIAKPVMVRFCQWSDYRRRRNAWVFLTIVAFISPSFWLYACVAAATFGYCSKRDRNPSALYLFLLNVIPPVAVVIPLGGSSQLLPVSNVLLLSLFGMIPAGRRLIKRQDEWKPMRLRAIDWCLLAHGIFESVFYIHLINPDGSFYPATVTDFARRSITFLLDIFVPYFVISRTNRSNEQIMECMAAFLLSSMLMAAIAVFESARGWLLYEAIPSNWGIVSNFSDYLMRGTILRAMASAGHSLSLGYLLAIGFGFWLCLKADINARGPRWAVTILLWSGLIAAFSRGPWICALGIFFAYLALQPKGSTALIKATLGIVAAFSIVAVTPLGRKILDVLPFFGGRVDNDSIVYRQRLWDRCIELISANPILGDQYALSKMQDLRQGQGIIDIVNGYVSELLGGGLIGLGLFLSVTLLALFGTWKASHRSGVVGGSNHSTAIASSLMACILGSFFLWGFGGVSEDILWALVALSAAYRWQSVTNSASEKSGNRRTIP